METTVESCETNKANQESPKLMLVYTVGTFDLLHVGHLALLEQCRALGEVVAVGVASDSVVNSYKPNFPVIPLDQREEMLKSLRCVDIVRPYYELEYVSACKELSVDIFVVGEDWGDNPHNIRVESYLRSEGKKIVQVSYNRRTSSTTIKNNVMAQTHIRSVPYSSRAAHSAPSVHRLVVNNTNKL
jgi:glycerol-3-phosphate cytidylyltransferase